MSLLGDVARDTAGACVMRRLRLRTAGRRYIPTEEEATSAMAARLRPRDRITLWAFLALWVFCMAMRVVTITRPGVHAVFVTAQPDGVPVVQELQATGPEPMVFRVGDRILDIAGRDVRGMESLPLVMTLVDFAWRSTDEVVPVLIERDGARMTVDGASSGVSHELVVNLVIALIWGIAAVLILLRAPSTPVSRALFHALAASAILYTASFRGPPLLLSISIAISLVALMVAQPLLIRAYLGFPDQPARLEGLNRYWPWAFSLVGVAIFAARTDVIIDASVARPLSTALVFVYVITLAIVITRNYRAAGPVGRRKIKWVVYAIYVGSIISLTSFAIGGVSPPDPRLWQSLALLTSSVTFPIFVLVAVLRFDLFDIDRLIGATVAYNLLAFVLVGGLLLFVPDVAQALSTALNMDPMVGRTGITMAVAGAVIVIQRQVRPHVDRVLFKERFALERALKELPEKLAAVRNADELWNTAGTEFTEHLNPASCVIFAVGEGMFVPIFSRGEANAPALSSSSDVVRWVERQAEATSVDRRMARDMGDLGFATLSGLEIRVVVPIQRRGVLEAFIWLGEKRSGDIYTATDLSLLTSLAKSLSIHLLRFDEADLLERSRAMQQKMRRYVPGAIAEHIEEGRDLEVGEREVSVLFVDIRGYTAYSEGRAADAIFSTVNRYTEKVSSIVRSAGGVVVEFNGDGMMAVFGAPRPLADKEAAAVSCAKRLVQEVSDALSSEGADHALSVGVGIATGPAFVGNIQAVDRTIWSAIGTTTNLAARLQSLTREMDASIIIDASTHARAVAEATGFCEHANKEIRGRREPVTIHALPIAKLTSPAVA